MDISWLLNNWMTVLNVLTGVVTAASLMVKALQPLLKATESDEKALGWLGKVSKWLSVIALNPKK